MASCMSSGTAEAWGLRHEDGPGAKTVEAGMLGGELRPLGFQDLTSRRRGCRAVQSARVRRRRARTGGRGSRTGPDSSEGGTGAGPQYYVMPIELVFEGVVHHVPQIGEATGVEQLRVIRRVGARPVKYCNAESLCRRVVGLGWVGQQAAS